MKPNPELVNAGMPIRKAHSITTTTDGFCDSYDCRNRVGRVRKAANYPAENWTGKLSRTGHRGIRTALRYYRRTQHCLCQLEHRTSCLIQFARDMSFQMGC